MTDWLRRYLPRIIAGLALTAVAAVTGRISYTHIYDLTLALHQPVMVARLMPFGVDGLIVVGSVVLLQPPPGQRWLGWLGVGPGAAISLFANVESGIAFGWLAAGWAGVPAVAFTLATFMLERWLKAQGGAVPEAASVPEPGPEPYPEVPDPAGDTAPDDEADVDPLIVWLTSGADGVPGAEHVPGPVPAAATALNGHAAEAERLFAAEIASGAVPGIRRIRSTMHVGQPKAEQVQAYLRTLSGAVNGTDAPVSATPQPAQTQPSGLRDARRDP